MFSGKTLILIMEADLTIVEILVWRNGSMTNPHIAEKTMQKFQQLAKT